MLNCFFVRRGDFSFHLIMSKPTACKSFVLVLDHYLGVYNIDVVVLYFGIATLLIVSTAKAIRFIRS